MGFSGRDTVLKSPAKIVPGDDATFAACLARHSLTFGIGQCGFVGGTASENRDAESCNDEQFKNHALVSFQILELVSYLLTPNQLLDRRKSPR